MSVRALRIDWYPGDALQGMEILNASEELAYRRLLDWLYVSGGSLPDDDRRIGHITKTGKKWPGIKKTLQSLGKIEIVGGGISNRKCSEILLAIGKKNEAASNAGKLSSDRRKSLKSKETRSTVVENPLVRNSNEASTTVGVSLVRNSNETPTTVEISHQQNSNKTPIEEPSPSEKVSLGRSKSLETKETRSTVVENPYQRNSNEASTEIQRKSDENPTGIQPVFCLNKSPPMVPPFSRGPTATETQTSNTAKASPVSIGRDFLDAAGCSWREFEADGKGHYAKVQAWIRAGYTLDELIEVARDKAPSLAEKRDPFAYADKFIAQAIASIRNRSINLDDDGHSSQWHTWKARVGNFHSLGQWLDDAWGPSPTSPGTQAPPEILEMFGYTPT